jgi:Zn-dependent protease
LGDIGQLLTGNLTIIITYLLGFLLVIPALTLHEWAHGWMANRLGDDTPRMLGRLTLNPIKHIDPIGTVLMPIALLVLSGGAFTFGYAKPVPINPRNFANPKHGMMLTGAAGPAMNVLLALITGFIIRMAIILMPAAIFSTSLAGVVDFTALGEILYRFAFINLALCFFNLIPLPPFDGSRIIQRFLTGPAREFYHKLEPYGMWIILGLVWGLPMLTGFSVISVYFQYTVQPILRILTGI